MKYYADAEHKYVNMEVLYFGTGTQESMIFHDADLTKPVYKSEAESLYYSAATAFDLNLGDGPITLLHSSADQPSYEEFLACCFDDDYDPSAILTLYGPWDDGNVAYYLTAEDFENMTNKVSLDGQDELYAKYGSNMVLIDTEGARHDFVRYYESNPAYHIYFGQPLE